MYTCTQTPSIFCPPFLRLSIYKVPIVLHFQLGICNDYWERKMCSDAHFVLPGCTLGFETPLIILPFTSVIDIYAPVSPQLFNLRHWP